MKFREFVAKMRAGKSKKGEAEGGGAEEGEGGVAKGAGGEGGGRGQYYLQQSLVVGVGDQILHDFKMVCSPPASSLPASPFPLVPFLLPLSSLALALSVSLSSPALPPLFLSLFSLLSLSISSSIPSFLPRSQPATLFPDTTIKYIFSTTFCTRNAVSCGLNLPCAQVDWTRLFAVQGAVGFGDLTSNLLLVGEHGNTTPLHYDEQVLTFDARP
eukprot:2808414-Rhodomonas_salina.1